MPEVVVQTARACGAFTYYQSPLEVSPRGSVVEGSPSSRSPGDRCSVPATSPPPTWLALWSSHLSLDIARRPSCRN